MKAAVIQLASGPKVEGNLEETRRLIQASVESGAQMVVLPENFAFMGNEETDKLAIAEPPDQGPIQRFISQMAREHAVWIIAGTIPVRTASRDRVYARCLVYDDRGEKVTHYDKVHLFDVRLTESNETYLESQTITAGKAPVWFDSPFGRIGLAVCYDLRFPEMFRALISHNIDILAIPSAFTATTGKAHWDVLLRARAIENLAYVLAANQGGFHVSGRETYGNSMIINPWGEILARLTSGSGWVVAELDRTKQSNLRESFPVLEHQRFYCGLN